MFEIFILRRKIIKENKKKSIKSALMEHSYCANCKYCKVKTEKICATRYRSDIYCKLDKGIVRDPDLDIKENCKYKKEV